LFGRQGFDEYMNHGYVRRYHTHSYSHLAWFHLSAFACISFVSGNHSLRTTMSTYSITAERDIPLKYELSRRDNELNVDLSGFEPQVCFPCTISQGTHISSITSLFPDRIGPTVSFKDWADDIPTSTITCMRRHV
jgi:hypothetical protein